MQRNMPQPRQSRPGAVWIGFDARIALVAWAALAVVIGIFVGWPTLLASIVPAVGSAFVMGRKGHFSYLPSVLAFAGAGVGTLMFSHRSVLGATIGAAIAGTLVAFAVLFVTLFFAHHARKR